jgi:beta-glucosidase
VGLPSLPNVPQPPRELKGFRRVELATGQSAKVSIGLDARSLSYWDAAAHGWKVAPGVYTVSAAASSRDMRLKGTFSVN